MGTTSSDQFGGLPKLKMIQSNSGKRVDSLPWQIDFCLKGTKSTHFTSGFNASALGERGRGREGERERGGEGEIIP